MARKFITILLLMIHLGLAQAATDEYSTVIAGDRDQVLSVVKTAMDSELPNGSVIPLNDQIGYAKRYGSFFMVDSAYSAVLTPMANKDDSAQVAYKVSLGSTVGALLHKSKVKSILKSIIDLAQKNDELKVINNTDKYAAIDGRQVRSNEAIKSSTLPGEKITNSSGVAYKDCVKKIEANSSYSPIKDKVALFSKDQLSNAHMEETYPSDIEKQAIVFLIDAQKACMSNAKEWNEKNQPPTFISIGDINFRNLISLKEGLRDGKLTYEEYATKTQAEANRMQEEIARLKSKIDEEAQLMAESSAPPYVRCNYAIERDPRVSLIKGKVAFRGLQSQSLEILTNDAKPSEAEKPAIAVYAAELNKCDLLNEAEIVNKKFPADFITLQKRITLETQLLIADLYAGKISYGGFAKARASNSVSNSEKWSQIAQVLKANAANQQAAIADRNQQLQMQQNQINAQEEQNRRALAVQYLQSQQQQNLQYQQIQSQSMSDLQRSLQSNNQQATQAQGQIMQNYQRGIQVAPQPSVIQPIINPYKPPIVTNCNQIVPGQISCSSQ